MRQAIKRLLDEAGLLAVAYSLTERLRVWRLSTRHGEDDAAPFADGLPVPPPRLIVAVGGRTNVAAYLHGGIAISEAIDRMLRTHHLDIGQARAMLDFGCGSGRVIRRWRHLAPKVALHGCDYNPALVEWCRANLPFAQFDVNQLQPPLPYAEGQFGLVYAFSVFTHFPARLGEAWMDDLRRVLSPGGHLLFSVHGRQSAAATLADDERARFDAGEPVVRYESVAGSNLCAAFHPESYIRHTLAKGWHFVAYEEQPAIGQDFVLLKKLEVRS